MTNKQPLDRQKMADRIAMEFQDGWVVNLGIGIPPLCANYVHTSRDITYQAENGLLNYGPMAVDGEEDLLLVNAGGQYVLPQRANSCASDNTPTDCSLDSNWKKLARD